MVLVSISDRLRNETYECMICCDRIRWTHAVWSCQLCYSVFHLRCAKRWASSCSGMQQEGQAVSSSGKDFFGGGGGTSLVEVNELSFQNGDAPDVKA